MFAYFLGLIAGLAQPLQTSINTKMGDKAKSPYIASVISFSTALLVLIVIILATQGGIHVPFADIAAYPVWIWFGGLCGTGIVVLSVVSLPQIGSAMTVVLTSFGQMLISLIIDQFGLFGSPQIQLTFTRVIGAILVIGGVLLASYNKPEAGAERKRYPFMYIVLATIAGVLCGTQIAINGTLGTVAQDSMIATTISMTVGLTGTFVLIAVIYITRGRAGVFRESEDIRFKWYMATGGLLAVVIVGGNAITAPLIGAGMVSILNLIGFMIGGLIIDAVGFLGIEKKPVTLAKVIGVVAMVGGTVVITLL